MIDLINIVSIPSYCPAGLLSSGIWSSVLYMYICDTNNSKQLSSTFPLKKGYAQPLLLLEQANPDILFVFFLSQESSELPCTIWTGKPESIIPLSFKPKIWLGRSEGCQGQQL